MDKRLATWVLGFGAVAVILGSCGGDSADEASSDETTEQTSPEEEETTPAPPAGASRADVETCLADAGLDLATGETPLISGAEGIGINPGQGPLQPGDVTAALFVYSSEKEAKGAATSLQGAAFQDIAAEGNVLIVYAVAPEAKVKTAIEACT